MEGFNLSKLRDYIPKELPHVQLPRLPTWPSNHRSMNPDEDEGVPSAVLGAQSDLPTDTTSTSEPIALVLEDPKPISSGPKSNLDLIDECDNFPYYQTQTELFFAHINTYYGLYVSAHPNVELGYMLPSVAQAFRGLADWKLDDTNRSLTLVTGNTEEERSRVVAMTCKALKGTGFFKILEGWRDELYPVYGPNKELLFSIERAASALFGIVTYGVHMTAYNMGKRPKSEAEAGGDDEELKLWVPRRAATKQTYGGMLDNTVAGGIATGESPFESVVRESEEEASLPADLVRKHAKAVGTVTYFHIRDHRAGGETRLLQPECQYVYDLKLSEDVVPKPSDDEVESFELKSVDEVKEALRAGEFKPNCALVLLDFFVRHGILTAEDEGYVEIVSRLHRRLEFPTI
jgi:8-oxo-dGTP pyrophosphatase MutT (NUDIX family)